MIDNVLSIWMKFYDSFCKYYRIWMEVIIFYTLFFFITPEPLAMEVNHNIFQTKSYIFTDYVAWNLYRNSDN